MKARIPPTSPKYKDKEKNIEDFYSQNNLGRIDRPLKKARSTFYALIISLIIGLLAGFLGGLLFILLMLNYPDSFILKKFNLHLPSTKETIVKENDASQIKTDSQREQLIQNLKPSLVNIFLKKEKGLDSFEQFYSSSEILGNGVVLTSDGWIITTNSVVSDLSKKYSIAQDNKEIHEVVNLLQDPATAFVFLKVEATDLKPVQFVDPDSLKLGQEALILRDIVPDNAVDLLVTNIVNLGYQDSLKKTNIIESTERFSRMIKVSYNPDELYRGAPLANSKGEVIALSIAQGETSRNMFLPLSFLNNKIISILLKESEIQRSYLGVNYIDLSKALNVPEALAQKMNKGALIFSNKDESIQAVAAKSPAEKAGLKENDIILSINDTEINQTNNLTETIQDYSVGENITLKILRKGKEQEVKVTLSKVR
jgi:S1-C subfamily serine protease